MRKILILTFLAGLSLPLMVPVALAEELRTLKERLSDKASDAQRVDNCGVPLERRGPIPRPDCVEKSQLATESEKAR